jgi:hypothetical protein
MRIYCDLVRGLDRIADRSGVEVSGAEHAQAATLTALEELREEDTSTAFDWAGWRMDVLDGSGSLLLSTRLDEARSDLFRAASLGSAAPYSQH